MSKSNPRLPGKLGNPDATLADDERADPRLRAVADTLDLRPPDLTPVDGDSSYEECLAYCSALDETAAAEHPQLLANLPVFDSVATSTEVITGMDGNEIPLFVHSPVAAERPVPGIVHIHGGGMAILSAAGPEFIQWRDSLADKGVVVVGVEFRNAGGRLGNHPFPAGLNDCVSAVRWVYANKARLGISTITLSGESGGGNLTLATALRANREGWIDEIDGAYAMCPYICGNYADPPAELVSLRENDDYGGLACSMMMGLVKAYDPSGQHGRNALAWPYHASADDLAGLPPHVISVNELDPLRDEGIAYYRKLAAARVQAIGRTVLGTSHSADEFFNVLPEICEETMRSIVGFARSL